MSQAHYHTLQKYQMRLNNVHITHYLHTKPFTLDSRIILIQPTLRPLMSFSARSMFKATLLFAVSITPLLSISLPSQAAPKARPPVPVFAEQVKSEPYVARIEALGTLKAQEAVTLSALVTKTIQAIHFDDGQRVKQGEVLVEMASREERALLQEAKVTASEAERQYERVKSLQKRNLASDAQLDERRLNYDTAQAKLEAVKARLADRTVIAPFDGVMGLRQVSLGTLVKPGDTIATLDDDRVMKLDISIPSIYLNTVKIGMAVNALAVDLNNQIFSGTIASVDSRIDPNTRSIRVRALLDNPDQHLVSGMLMQVTLEQAPKVSLTLPEEALVQEGTKKFAYVVDRTNAPAVVEKRQLTVGPRTNGKVVVTSGLILDDWVVTRGTMRLNPGAAVTLQQSPLSAEQLQNPNTSSSKNTNSNTKDAK